MIVPFKLKNSDESKLILFVTIKPVFMFRDINAKTTFSQNIIWLSWRLSVFWLTRYILRQQLIQPFKPSLCGWRSRWWLLLLPKQNGIRDKSRVSRDLLMGRNCQVTADDVVSHETHFTYTPLFTALNVLIQETSVGRKFESRSTSLPTLSR